MSMIKNAPGRPEGVSWFALGSINRRPSRGYDIAYS